MFIPKKKRNQKISYSKYFFLLAKPKIDGKVNDVTVQITEPAELRTKFSAIPKPTVTWFVFFSHLFFD